MFNSLGWPELTVLLVLALFVFGPERLPGAAAQAGRTLRSLRSYARSLRDDLADDLGPEIREVNLRSLQNPRRLVVKHLLTDPEDGAADAVPGNGSARARRPGTAARPTAPASRDVPRQPDGPPARDTDITTRPGEPWVASGQRRSCSSSSP